MTTQVGLSYKEIAEAITSFLEISLHTILYLRQIYPATTFTRRRAHSVPVYQSRHPTVRSYISEVVSFISKELLSGRLKRLTVVVKSVESGLPLERYIFDLGYLGELGKLKEGRNNEIGLIGAPTADELSLMLRGFLIKLSALDGQLLDNRGETTFALIVETDDELEPSSNEITDGSVPPWIPALSADTLRPPPLTQPSSSDNGADCSEKHEPLLSVKAIETGVIDIRLMVQECVAKTGVDHLQLPPT